MKIKIKFLDTLDYYTFNENAYRGEVYFRIGLHNYYTQFLTNIGEEEDKILIAFLENWKQKLPKDKTIHEQILVEIYSELCKLLGKWDAQAFFRKQKIKREEEERKRKEEEERKIIKVGEQVTFEKWFANEKK